MEIVSLLVETAKSQLSSAAQSQYGITASAIGGAIKVGATLTIILAFLKQIFQLRPMEITQFAWLLIKLILIHQFATVWSQFDAFANAIISGMDNLGGTMLSGNMDNVSLARTFDKMLTDLGASADATLDNLSYMAHAFMSGIFIILQSIVAATASLILIFAVVMITIHLGLAPIFIGLSMFAATKDFFFKWLQSTITYALYPVVIAVVLGTIINLTKATINNINPDNIQSIAALIPFIVVLIIMITTILLIPTIVSGLSGAITAAGPLTAAAVANNIYRNLQPAGKGARAIGGVAANTGRAASSKAQEYGRKAGSAVNAVRRQIQRSRKY